MQKISLLSVFLFLSAFSFAQKKKETLATPTSLSPIASKTAGMQKYEGYQPFYFDVKQDKIYFEISQFDVEFLYIVSLTAGVGSNDIGLDRNQLSGERIVKWERRGTKVLLVEPNYKFRAISDSKDERRAVQEAFAQSVLGGFKIEAEREGSVLIDATDFFMQDAHDVIGTLRATNQGNYQLDKNRSAWYMPRIKNFPKNTEFEVVLTFTGQPTGAYIRNVTPTPNSVTVRQHHSFVALPEPGYQPRVFDPRAGYFSISYYDYATPIDQPIEKRFITRHRLEKKNPEAAKSEAIKPIVYYLDRGTPEPIRTALLDGAKWWNQAFEAAGYIHAFQVEMLPEDADPMDVRYNVINWVHRATRGWSYGASVIDPRTGEIIKGHVTLGSLRVRQDYLIAEGLLAPYKEGKPVSKEMEQLALARLRQLSAHEIGHTLGLAHSYASSSENLASVMDYPHPYVYLDNGRINVSKAYDDKIGAWDKVSIAYGYQDFPAGTDEKNALNKIIADALQNGLTFLSDQDARPFGSAHPYAHLWDNGHKAHDELTLVLAIRKTALENFGLNNIKPGAPVATLHEVLVPMYFFHRYQTEAAAKVIGGLNYRYALRGDGQPVTELITAQEQQKALDALLQTVSIQHLAIPERIVSMLAPRPLGYDPHRELMSGRTDVTFDALAAPETAADMTFRLLLYPARVNRLVEHHARNQSQPSLSAILQKITFQIYNAKFNSAYEQAVGQVIAQSYLQQLIRLVQSNDVNTLAKAEVQNELKNILRYLSSTQTIPLVSKQVREFQAGLIAKWQTGSEDVKLPPVPAAPPGQPIGSTELDCYEQLKE
ncbi:MAG: zinc-dependent metalloprotease [Chryseotalea sp.]